MRDLQYQTTQKNLGIFFVPMAETCLFKLFQGRKLREVDHDVLATHAYMIAHLQKSHGLEKHSGCINTLAWNHEGTKLVSGSDDRTVVIWGKCPLEEIIMIPTGHRNNVFCASFLPGSQDESLVTSAADGYVHLLNVESGQRDVLYESEISAYCFKHCSDMFYPNHVGYVTLSDGYVVRFDTRSKSGDRVTNLRTDAWLRAAAVGRFSSPPSGTAIAFNPIDPHVIAVGTSTKMVQLFDVRDWSKPVSRIVPNFSTPAHGGSQGEAEVAVSGFDWDKRNRIIVNYCRQSVIEIDTGLLNSSDEPCRYSVGSSVIPRFWTGRLNHQTFLKEVALLGNGKYVATGGDCGNLFVWERFGTQRLILKKPADPYVLNCVAPHPYLPVLATSGIASVADIWEPTGEISEPEIETSVDESYETESEYSSEESVIVVPLNELSVEQATERLSEANILKAEGNELFRSRDLLSALEKYSELVDVLRFNCGDPIIRNQQKEILEKAFTNKAAAHMGIGQWVGAVDACREALAVNPRSVRAFVRRSKCHIRLGQFGSAIDDIERALEVDPGDAEALAVLAQIRRANTF